MNNIQEAIQDAIKGGWKRKVQEAQPILHRKFGLKTAQEMYLAWVFTDPAFWRALGKTKGWDEDYYYRQIQGVDPQLFAPHEAWAMNWHRFIHYLSEGKSIDQALAEIK